jgi:hypothetical protein
MHGGVDPNYLKMSALASKYEQLALEARRGVPTPVSPARAAC